MQALQVEGVAHRDRALEALCQPQLLTQSVCLLLLRGAIALAAEIQPALQAGVYQAATDTSSRCWQPRSLFTLDWWPATDTAASAPDVQLPACMQIEHLQAQGLRDKAAFLVA